MSTKITSHNPARNDVPEGAPAVGGAMEPTSRTWSLAGIGAGVLGLVGTTLGTLVTPVYDESLRGDAEGIAAAIGDFVGVMTGFQVTVTLAALLMAVFAVGLHRRLRAALPATSLLPGLAAAGLLGTSVVLVMGTTLNTEFIFGFGEPDLVLPETAAMYNHWIGTVPGVWVLVGLTALSVFAAARAGAMPVWLGRVGLVLGGLTLLVGIAPVQYMAGATGGLWLLVTAIGLTVGDKEFRSA